CARLLRYHYAMDYW
nr:immunoglobulin heavy chain junction region [Mus musculus]